MDIGGVAFNPLVPNQLIASAGTGVWNVVIPSNVQGTNYPETSLTYNDMSLGIEQLVANEIIVPPGGDPVVASWDRPFFQITNLDSYPTTYGPIASANINAGWSVDYASSTPSFLVGLTGDGGADYSTNGGQTWTAFASSPSFPGQANGGTIAASTPENIILAPANGVQPYYTLNGGASWSPITLPGVSSWSNFEGASYLDERSITADRVLANTFYLYYPGYGVFETTNGGVSWTNVYSGNDGYGSSWNGYITPFDWYNNEIMSVPGEGGNLFFTGGYQSGTQPDTQDPFMRSTNGGATWTAVPNVLEVSCFGFGAAAPGQSYPSIYIVGYVNSVYGIWQSTNNAQSWTQIGTYPNNSLDTIKTISGDPNIYGQVYVGFQGSGYAVLVAPPSVVGVTATGAGITNNAGTIGAGTAVTFTVSLTATVTVAGGAPTLSLNDGGTATYVSGSGTNALVFTYTVGSGQSASGLAITGVNLPSGVTVQDDVATAAVFTGADTTFTGLTVAAGGSALSLTVAQATALETAGGSAPSGDVVTLSDTAANIEGLTAAQIGGLKAIGVTAIAATNASVSWTSAQAVALETAGLKVSAPSGDTVTLSDTAANIDGLTPTQITGLDAIGVTGIIASGAVILSVADAMALETAGLAISDPTLSDTAANIESLTATEIRGLDAIGVTTIAVTNGSVSFSVAQAIALETEGLKVSAPSGDFVTLSDTAANIATLTAAQIAGLEAIGVTAIVATGASLSLSVAQTSAVTTAGLSVSAPANDTVTEHNADGSYDIHYYGVTGTFQGVSYASYDYAYTSSGFRDLLKVYGAGGNDPGLGELRDQRRLFHHSRRGSDAAEDCQRRRQLRHPLLRDRHVPGRQLRLLRQRLYVIRLPRPLYGLRRRRQRPGLGELRDQRRLFDHRRRGSDAAEECQRQRQLRHPLLRRDRHVPGRQLRLLRLRLYVIRLPRPRYGLRRRRQRPGLGELRDQRRLFDHRRRGSDAAEDCQRRRQLRHRLQRHHGTSLYLVSKRLQQRGRSSCAGGERHERSRRHYRLRQ